MTMGCCVISTRILLVGFAVGCTYLATMFIIVGLTTNYWKEIKKRGLYDEDTEVSMGLHRVCWISSSRCNNPDGSYDEAKVLPSVQGLVITAGFVAVAASCLSLVNLYYDRLGRSRPLIAVLATAACIISGILVLIGAIIFAVKVKVESDYISIGRKTYEGYSFGLTVVAGILLIAGAVLNGVSGLFHAEQVFNIN